MKNNSLSILQESKLLSLQQNRILSKDLQPVIDLYNSTMLTTWRESELSNNIPLHKMMSRVGGFPASLASYFIAAYTKPEEFVLDPFCGKGTSLLEAVRMGRVAIGGDIAPDAVIVSRAKSNPPTIAEVCNYIQNLPINIKVSLSDVPKDVVLFFSSNTLKQILSIREFLFKDLNSSNPIKKKLSTFVCGLILGILHGKTRLSLSLPCNQCFAMSPSYVRKYVKEHNLKKPDRDVKECLIQRSLELLPAPKNMAHSSVFERSAENCYEYMEEQNIKANLVLTSPPYLNRQTYLRDSWLRLWFLNRDWHKIKKLSLETGSLWVFYNGISKVISAVWRSLVKNGKVVFVCGKAGIEIGGKKTIVNTSEICLLAIKKLKVLGYPFEIESIISDNISLKRGSYFAVTHGKGNNKNNAEELKHLGKDEILILKKREE